MTEFEKLLLPEGGEIDTKYLIGTKIQDVNWVSEFNQTNNILVIVFTLDNGLIFTIEPQINNDGEPILIVHNEKLKGAALGRERRKKKK